MAAPHPEVVPEADTIPEIADDLREDPVLVHQLVGAGDTAGTHDRLTDLAEQVADTTDVPVYVALVQVPRDVELAEQHPSDDLMRQVHTELGEPGLYIVSTSDGWVAMDAYDVPAEVQADVHAIGSGLYDAQEHLREGVTDPEAPQLGIAGQAALALEIAADDDHELSDQQVDEFVASGPWMISRSSPPSPFEDDEVALDWPLMIAVAVAVALCGTIWMALAMRRGMARAKPSAGRASDGVAERHVRRQIELLRDALEQSTADGLVIDEATRSLDLAQDLHARGGPVARTGGWVIAQQAMAALGGRTHTPCYFNPIHPPATVEARAGSGRGAVTVPACRECADAVGRGQQPAAFLVSDGGRVRPYYELDSPWARTGFGALAPLWREVERSST